jgi:hypothetical protein
MFLMLDLQLTHMRPSMFRHSETLRTQPCCSLWQLQRADPRCQPLQSVTERFQPRFHPTLAKRPSGGAKRGVGPRAGLSAVGAAFATFDRGLHPASTLFTHTAAVALQLAAANAIQAHSLGLGVKAELNCWSAQGEFCLPPVIQYAEHLLASACS